MPDILHPGVYIEELPTVARPIEGVATSTAAFVGAGPRHLDPTVLTSFADFERIVGDGASPFVALAVRGFFLNGGRRCVVAVGDGPNAVPHALARLEAEEFSILCCPDEHQFADAAEEIVTFCERRRNVLALLQPVPPLVTSAPLPGDGSSFVARYYPWLVVPDRDGHGTLAIPPAGHVAGAYARSDLERGVHHSPDGLRLIDVHDVSAQIGAAEAETLTARRINLIRQLPDRTIVTLGDRTATDHGQFRYVNVRRLFNYIEESIRNGMQWVVFERNPPAVWVTVMIQIQDFLTTEWRRGALIGSTADHAFFVRCDCTTRTQEDIDSGRFVAIVGVAPLRPAEFVILRFTAQTIRKDDGS
jgi:phage tail sheath protein FI